MSTKLRDAAKLAKDWIVDDGLSCSDSMEKWERCTTALDALREALAEPEAAQVERLTDDELDLIAKIAHYIKVDGGYTPLVPDFVANELRAIHAKLQKGQP